MGLHAVELTAMDQNCVQRKSSPISVYTGEHQQHNPHCQTAIAMFDRFNQASLLIVALSTLGDRHWFARIPEISPAGGKSPRPRRSRNSRAVYPATTTMTTAMMMMMMTGTALQHGDAINY